MVDSQSVKSTAVGGEERGYDGGKKVKGRKRHLLVDTEGFVLKAKVHSAKVMDFEKAAKCWALQALHHKSRLTQNYKVCTKITSGYKSPRRESKVCWINRA